MEWHERMTTTLEVGKSYENRRGHVMDVIAKLSDNDYHVTNKSGLYSYPEYTNGYIVTKNGGFGSYPNPRDLVVSI